MHKHFLRVAAWLVLTGGLSFAQQGADLSQHVYFKHMIGKWAAEGDLKVADGNIVKVTEEWEAKATPEGEVVIEGKREINNDKQTFRWSITRNAATDTFSSTLVTNGDEAGKLQFEVNVSEVNMTAEFKATTGTNSGVLVLDSFPDEKKETMTSVVTLTGDSGETTLSGTITHKRTKAP